MQPGKVRAVTNMEKWCCHHIAGGEKGREQERKRQRERGGEKREREGGEEEEGGRERERARTRERGGRAQHSSVTATAAVGQP